MTPGTGRVDAFPWPTDEKVLADLQRRLRNGRWPDAVAAADEGAYGFPLRELQAICRYWAHEFDWRTATREVAAFPQFTAEIDGYRIHFVHVRGARPQALPLLLTHGWPGSFLEFRYLLPLLSEFDLVAPSLPGFGFSSHPAAPGCNTFVIAEVWAKLMRALGHERFGVQGGDIGASVSSILAWRHPERVVGIHLNYLPGSYRPHLGSEERMGGDEEAFFAARTQWAAEFGAYEHVQRTEPQTLAYGLNDAPAGLAAWILQRFRNWSDGQGELQARFRLDDLLANVTLYWLTGTIASSCRMYRECAGAPLTLAKGERIAPPMAFAQFPKEISAPPRAWVERGYNVARWSTMPRGGHFAALEVPELLAGDMRAFFKSL